MCLTHGDRTVDTPTPLCRSTGSFKCGYCGKCFRFYSEMLLHASLSHSRDVVRCKASIGQTEQSCAEKYARDVPIETKNYCSKVLESHGLFKDAEEHET